MLGLGFYGIQMWNDGICDECGELTCLGTVWCEACADYHHGYTCKPEPETPTPEQAALDTEQFPDAATYQERHLSDAHFVGMY